MLARPSTLPALLALALALACAAMSACGGDDAVQFLAACDTTNDRCDKTLDPPLSCRAFNMKGTFCTHACTMDAQCAAPSTGCNMMGFCKVP